MQKVLASEPIPPPVIFDWSIHSWNCNWIEDPAWDGVTSHACAFRRVFTLDAAAKIRFHISADQRYTLYIDGMRNGFGPERGDDANWFYQTHEVTLQPGEHRLVAVVWWTNPRQGLFHLGYHHGLSHLGHLGHRPALMVRGEGAMEEILSTGRGPWEVMPLDGVSFHVPAIKSCGSVGGRTRIDAARMPRGYEAGADGAGAWRPARKTEAALLRTHATNVFNPERLLRHGTLPPMIEKTIPAGTVRHAQPLDATTDPAAIPFDPAKDDAETRAAFQRMLDGQDAVTVPASTTLRVLIDLDDYVCAWPILDVAGGAGAEVQIDWAESLYEDENRSSKGNRDTIDGKFFLGIGDTLVCNGDDVVFEPFWWEAGRYIRLLVKTVQAPLTITSLKLRETHYPHRFASRFTCDDRRWRHVFKISKRVLEMCSHETYMDCPYY
ncbi:MAG: alpha-L-rhamnosidase, partial [Kiritimatiellia bacterium]